MALRKMFLRRDQRGSGLGSRLLEAALTWAHAQAIDTVVLGSTDVMTGAHALYERHGFEAIEPDRPPSAFPRMAVDSVFYRLDLESPPAVTP